MDDLPSLSFHMPNPLYWYSNKENKGYIIFTLWHGDGEALSYKYDIASKKYHVFATYEDVQKIGRIEPKACAHAINLDTNQLYVIGGHSDTFAIYNLESQTWRIYDYTASNLPSNISYPAWCMLPPPFNQFYLYAPKTHKTYLLSPNNSKFECVGECAVGKPPGTNSKMVFVNNTLLLVSSNKDARSMFVHGITDNVRSQRHIEWKECKLQLPEAMNFRHGHKCIVAFDSVVVIFRVKGPGVYRWYLDLGGVDMQQLNEENCAWIGEDITAVFDGDAPEWNSTYCVLTSENMVHFFYPYDSAKGTYHKEMALSKLIPRAVCAKYTGVLVFGYVRELERTDTVSQIIPTGVVDIIVMFFC